MWRLASASPGIEQQPLDAWGEVWQFQELGQVVKEMRAAAVHDPLQLSLFRFFEVHLRRRQADTRRIVESAR